jgi:hypothetical protein
MERKIDVAADHGLTAFLFDWYWYEGGPFLQRALERAFMVARNCDRLDFAVMWANHDWANIHPWKRSTNVHGDSTLAAGAVDAANFTAATDYVIEYYFHHPSYLKINGRPFFSIYDIWTLNRGLGGVDGSAEAIRDLRRRAKLAGFPGVHVNLIAWEPGGTPNTLSDEAVSLVARLGADSVTSYVWLHHHPLPDLLTPYRDVLEDAERGWRQFAEQFQVPYLPNVTVGWDSSPRTVQSDRFDPAVGYPHTNVIVGNTPTAFGEALSRAKDFLDRTAPEPRLVTVNAWNEWTEGSYLEPDSRNGMSYLEQIRRVFGAPEHNVSAALNTGSPAPVES